MSRTYDAFKKLDERQKPDGFENFARFTDSIEGPERRDWPVWAFWIFYIGTYSLLAYWIGRYLGVF